MVRKVAIVHNAYGKPSGEEVVIDNPFSKAAFGRVLRAVMNMDRPLQVLIDTLFPLPYTSLNKINYINILKRGCHES